MVTRKDVAKKAGVSEGTVSNVINNKVFVKPEKRDVVLKVIKELNYIPDQTARNLARRKSSHIGIAIYETTNPYHMEIIKKIEDYAIKRGYIVSTFMLDNNMSYKLKSITERKLDGLVNFMTNLYPDEFIETLKRMGTVLINFDESNSSMFINDYTEAMKNLMIKLKELGHKKIAYISCLDEKNFAVDSRGIQFKKSVKELGFKKADIYYNHNFDSTSDEIGVNLTKQLLLKNKNVTAIFCTNDLAAIGCIRALADKGIYVPKDISVIGCDNINISSILYPSLTTITIDKAKQGEEIAMQIIEQISTKKSIVKHYVAKEIIRESLAKAKQ